MWLIEGTHPAEYLGHSRHMIANPLGRQMLRHGVGLVLDRFPQQRTGLLDEIDNRLCPRLQEREETMKRFAFPDDGAVPEPGRSEPRLHQRSEERREGK